MEFIIYAVVMLATLAISEYTRPLPEDARPAGLGDFQVNTASEDRHIPVIWGKPNNPGMNVLWHGHLRTVPIEKEIEGLFHDDYITVGYQYYIGMHLGFNVGDANAKLLRITVGDKLFADFGAGVGKSWHSNVGDWSFFGGEDGNGGMVGNMAVFPGYRGQGVSGYLQYVLGPRVPEFNKISAIVWEQGYIGNSTFLKQWDVQWQRLPQLLGTGKHNIDGEANPAEMLYEILSNVEWGMSANTNMINTATFIACAQTLYDEGMGMSLLWDQGKTIEQIIKEILKHIDGVLFLNALTGKFEMSLMRKTENIEALPVIDNTKCKRKSFSRPGIDELVNEVKVIYTDLVNRKDKVVHAQDLGQYMAFDRQIVSTEVQYKGFSKKNLALRCAERDLRRSSYPLALVVLENVHREFHDLVPGSKFIYVDPELGVEKLVMTVLDVDYGSQTSNKMNIEAIQDVFALGDGSIYTDPNDTLFEPIDGTAQDIVDYKVMEAPYYFNKLSINTAAPNPIYAGLVASDASKIQWMRPMILAKDPTGNSLGFKLWKSINSQPFVREDTTRRMCPVGFLEYDFGSSAPVNTDSSTRKQDLVIRSFNLPKSGSSLRSIIDEEEIAIGGNNLIVIDNEIIAYKTIEFIDPFQDLIRVTECWRGMLDTPKENIHKAGAIVWFISLGNAATSGNYFYGSKPGASTVTADPSSVDLKFATVAILGAQDVTEAAGATLSNSGRAYKPYLPDNIKINGEESGTTRFIAENADIVVSWEKTNRLTQTCSKETADNAIAFETGTKYFVKVYDGAGTLKHTSVAQTGNSYTFTKALEDTLSFSYDGALSVEISVTRDDTMSNTPTPAVVVVPGFFTERIYFHRERPSLTPSGDYYDMMLSSRPVCYLGIEE